MSSSYTTTSVPANRNPFLAMVLVCIGDSILGLLVALTNALYEIPLDNRTLTPFGNSLVLYALFGLFYGIAQSPLIIILTNKRSRVPFRAICLSFTLSYLGYFSCLLVIPDIGYWIGGYAAILISAATFALAIVRASTINKSSVQTAQK